MKKVIIPFFLAALFSFLFYHRFFTKHLIPAPLDIITSMYLPWMDADRDIFPNGGPVKNPLPSDVISLTLPLRQSAVNIIKSGQIPLWNPNILAGTPLLANFQSAILNPLNILYFTPLKFIDAWSIQVILQSTFAFIFFYLFISQYSKNTYSRILGSLIWAFNGFFTLWFQYNTVVYAAIYLPVLFYAIDIFPTKRTLSILIIPMAIVLSILSGNPPVSLIIITTSAIYTLYKYARQFKLVTFIAILFVLGLLISAPQLGPGLASSQNSIRQYDRIADEVGIKYLPPIKLFTLVIPDFFGNPSTRNTWKNTPLYDNTTVYTGLIPVIFWLIGVKIKNLLKKHSPISFHYYTTIICLVLMLPQPISHWLGNQNFLGLSSMVFTRVSFVFFFSLAFISSLILDWLSRHLVTYKIILPPLITVFLFIAIPASLTFGLNHYFQSVPFIDTDWINQTRTAYRNTILPLALLISLSATLVSFRYRFFNKFAPLLLILITFFDLYRFFTKYNTFSSPSSYYPTTEVTTYLQNNSFRFARESAEIIPSNTWMNYPSLSTPSGYDTTYSQYYGGLISLANGGKLTDHPNRFLEIDSFSSPILNQLSVDHILVTKKGRNGLSDQGTITSSVNPKQFSLAKDYGRYQLLKNNLSLPFIRSVSKIIQSDNLEEIQKILPSIPTDTAIITDQANPFPLSRVVKIENIKNTGQAINFSVSINDNPGFIVISQNFDPGWNLRVDNSKAKIFRTNYALTGFFVPPGSHQITLTYQPQVFNTSKIISCISITALFIIATINWLWTKKHLR